MSDMTLNQANVIEETAEKEQVNFSKTEKIYSAVIMLLAFLYMEFEIFNPLGFFTTLVNILIITASIIFLKKEGCKIKGINRLIAIILYTFTTVFTITDNGYIKFLVSVFLFGAGAYFVYSAAEGKKEIERFLPFAMTKAVFEFPFSHFSLGASAAKAGVGNTKITKNIKYIIIGLIITFPITAVVAALLISADEGMENFFDTIAKNFLSEKIFEHILRFAISIPAALYLYGMLYSNCKRDRINKLDPDRCEYSANTLKFMPNIILYTAVTPILLLYIMFFISQANYFLSAFAGTLPEGYSYSAYARRGFFELCGITFINLLIIIFMSCFAQNGGKNKSGGFKFYITTLSASTLILIAVAVSKMVMYISKYGLTQLRFYTMWFMLLCGMLFILIIVKQFKTEINFAGRASGIFTVMFALLCFCCPDRLITMYNIDMYVSGYLDELDTETMCEMSDDAILYAYNHGAIDAETAYNCAHIDNDDAISCSNISSFILHKTLSAN